MATMSTTQDLNRPDLNGPDLARPDRPAVIRYGTTILAVAAALAGAVVVDTHLQSAPLVSIFFCAILFSAWIGGLGPGLVATALSLIAFDLFFLKPISSLSLAEEEIPRLAMFAIAALFMVSLTAAQRRLAVSLRSTRADLQSAVRNLETLNRALQSENAERRRAEEDSRQAEGRLQRTIDGIPVIAAGYDRDGRIDFVNKAWRDYTGLTLDSAERHRWGVGIYPDDLPAVEAGWRAHLASGEAFQLEHRLRRADGVYRWFLIHRVPFRNDSGEVVRWYGAGYDIEDYKRALERLRRNETYLEEAQQVSHTGSIGWNVATGRSVWSKETFKIMGVDDSVPPSFDLVLARTHPDDRPLVRQQLDAIAQDHQNFDFEHRLVMDDGGVKHIHVRARRVAYPSGREEILGAVMDVTEARQAQAALGRAQAELAHANRVATLGEMSASIAHEVNQPLAAIVTNGEVMLRLLSRQPPDIAEAGDAARQIVRDAHRATGVVRRVREMAKKADAEMVRLDLNRLVKDTVALVRREALQSEANVRMSLAADLPPVLADRVQLQQVILNLSLNGLQAMASVADRERVLTIRTDQDAAGQARVAIEDVGTGIDPQGLDRLFEAFYTTKPQGLGMGLSICRSIMEAHGGRVWASRNDGPGMTFCFSVPLAG